ncbi:MAG TPA: hypothetical protein VGG48_16485 [Rhizomicrobium sp.]|jgi:hypothetical protein
MSERKRFNVWIAYSDLFSNLAVFLFISAFGMLAAIGSSNMPGTPSPPPSQPGCVKSLSDFDGSMLGKSGPNFPSEFSPGPPGAPSQPIKMRCATLYTMPNYQFRNRKFDIASFLNERKSKKVGGKTSVRERQDALLHQMCEQLWGAVAREAMVNRNGQIILVGTDTADSAPVCSNRAETLAPEQKKILHDFSPRARQQIFDCQKHIYDDEKKLKLPEECTKFRGEHRDCYGSDATRDTKECSDLFDYLEEAQLEQTSCLKAFAAQRAESLYDYCRDSALNPTMQFTSIWSKWPNTGRGCVHDNDRNYGVLRRMWDREVQPRGAPPKDDAPIVRDSIYVSIEFDAQPSDRSCAQR